MAPGAEEGVVKYRAVHQVEPIAASAAVDEILAWRSRLFELGFIGEDEDGVGYGNLSVRLFASPRFLISGTQTSALASVSRRHFALIEVVDLERNHVRSRGEVRASSEALTHAALYQADPAIRGVAHVHAPRIWRQRVNRLPTTAPDVEYGTPAMGHEMIRLYRRGRARGRGVFVMGGHRDGLIAFGPSFAAAVQEILALADTS